VFELRITMFLKSIETAEDPRIHFFLAAVTKEMSDIYTLGGVVEW